MRTSRIAKLAACMAVATLAVTGWLAPAWGRAVDLPGRAGWGTDGHIALDSNSQISSMSRSGGTTALAADIAAARQATAGYATNLAKAKAAGYFIITKMMPSMGYHFLNPKISGFNVRKPPILVYEHVAGRWQLGALEWVFPTMPKDPPLPNATFGFFPAACHYADGQFVPDKTASTCPKHAPHSHAKFTFWHPDLTTMHFWIWYPNPDGLYGSTNPLVRPFNNG
jgi:hypothetical protein